MSRRYTRTVWKICITFLASRALTTGFRCRALTITSNIVPGPAGHFLPVPFSRTVAHASAREGLFCPTYVLMPDHLHLIWMGLKLASDQINGMRFLRKYLTGTHPSRFNRRASS
jgi:hypothetical protein